MEKKTNKQLIIEVLEKEGNKLDCYDERIEKIRKKDLKELLHCLDTSNDVDVKINGRDYIIEVDFIYDDEHNVDLHLLSKSEYINRYGYERFELD